MDFEDGVDRLGGVDFGDRVDWGETGLRWRRVQVLEVPSAAWVDRVVPSLESSWWRISDSWAKRT